MRRFRAHAVPPLSARSFATGLRVLCSHAHGGALKIAVAMAALVLAAPAVSADTHARLAELLDQAPSRQIGQPGNEVVDQWVHDSFARLVTQNNSSTRQEAADAAFEKVHQADQALLDLERRREQFAQGDQLADSFWLVRVTLEEPLPSVAALFVVALLFFAGWRMQRERKSLAIVVGAAIVLGLIMPLAAWLIDTPAESASTHGPSDKGGAATSAQFDRAITDAANHALLADHEAAVAVKGLWQHGRMTYPSVKFISSDATLRIGGSGAGDQPEDADDSSREPQAMTLVLHQMAPNLVDPGNIPGGRFEGRLVYAGTVQPDDLIGKDFHGAAAVIEYDCQDRWLEAVNLGAVMVIVLEPRAGDVARFFESVHKRSDTPLSIPRFYARRAAWTRVLGDPCDPAFQQRAAAVTIEQPRRARWEHTQLATDWLFIPGTAPIHPDVAMEKDAGQQVVHIQAYKDSNSIVPSISPGASSAANLVLLMELAERLAKHPPRRPVLLSAVNGHTNSLFGEHEWAYHAFVEPSLLVTELKSINQQLAQQELIHETYSQSLSHEVIEHIRQSTVYAGGQQIRLRKPGIDRLGYVRNQLRARRESLERQLGQISSSSDAIENGDASRAADLEAQIEAVEAHANELVRLMGLFNRFGQRVMFDDLTASQKNRLADTYADITQRAGAWAAAIGLRRDALLANLSVRRRLRLLHAGAQSPLAPIDRIEDIFAARNPPTPCIMSLQLDLSFGTDRIGVFHWDATKGMSGSEQHALTRVSRLARHLVRVANEFTQAKARDNPFVDTLRSVGGVPWLAHQAGKHRIGGAPLHDYQRPGLSLTNIRDFRVRAFGPHDTIDRINRSHLDDTADFVNDFLPAVIDSDGLGLTYVGAAGRYLPLTVHLEVRKLDKFSAGVSQTRVPGALTLQFRGSGHLEWNTTMCGQVQPWVLNMTDAGGQIVVRGRVWAGASMHAFGIDPHTGEFNATIDLVTGDKQFASMLEFQETKHFSPHTIMTFDARKVDLIGLAEPLTMAAPLELDVIDAHQESEPQHFLINGALATTKSGKSSPTRGDGTASLWLEPHVHFKLRTGQGVAINADDEHPEGHGYPIDTGMLRQVGFQSARDMSVLTRDRLDKLNRRGVVTDMAAQYIKQTDDLVDQAQQSSQSLDNLAARNDAMVAQGIGYRAYTRALSIVNDLIKAVIFFLMLVIPFCYFLMKLITPFTSINKQLMMFAAIFGLMAVLLQAVHPAFAVAQTPTMVVLAFSILGLAGFVAIIMVSQFNESMTKAVEAYQKVESTDAPQSRLAGVAFVVGVNNMKRRRIRTTLTCVTIVLVTFTMLSVISVSQDVEPVQLRLSRSTPYDGWVYTRPGLPPIEPLALRRLRDVYRGRAQSVARAWVQRRGSIGEYYPIEIEVVEPSPDAPDSKFAASVLLGLEQAEDGFLDDMPIVAGRWFSANDAKEIILTRKTAGFLGITEADADRIMLRIGDLDVKLVGLLDEQEFLALRDLGDLPIAPLISLAKQGRKSEQEAYQRKAEQSGTAALTGSGNLLADPDTRLAEGKDIAIIPIDLCRHFDRATYHSLSFKYVVQDPAPDDSAGALAPSARAWNDAKQMINFQHARIAVGLNKSVELESDGRSIEPGQYAIASSGTTEIGGILKVAIPIILAATIILNTMLGSVLERKREVSIYNAIGLNPGHVMMFFLAESVVFGLVGSVAGYIIGQLLSLGLSQYLDLNLNYSSTAVMVVIMLSIATVLLSTVYPAMMAARAAVPSGQRRWNVPQPNGDDIHVDFPFSYDRTRVLGVCAYLHEYMKQNSEASTGQFLARARGIGTSELEPGAQGDPEPATTAQQTTTDEHPPSPETFVMLYDIAPAPFDLGVNQQMEIYAYYNPKVRAHMLSVHLTRKSGQLNNWKTVNQPFLEALRKRLLGWRSQKSEHQQEYCQRGDALFANVQAMPLRNVP